MRFRERLVSFFARVSKPREEHGSEEQRMALKACAAFHMMRMDARIDAGKVRGELRSLGPLERPLAEKLLTQFEREADMITVIMILRKMLEGPVSDREIADITVCFERIGERVPYAGNNASENGSSA